MFSGGTMFKANPEREAVVAKLADYLVGLPDGEEVSWLRVEADTGVKMDTLGRGAVRRALARLKRPYEAVRGSAIRLSSPATALAIMHDKFKRIDGAVVVAGREHRHIVDRHLAQMTNDEQKRIIMLGAFFGAVRTIAKQNAPIFT
jgi:hypothetical protein